MLHLLGIIHPRRRKLRIVHIVKKLRNLGKKFTSSGDNINTVAYKITTFRPPRLSYYRAAPSRDDCPGVVGRGIVGRPRRSFMSLSARERDRERERDPWEGARWR